MKTQEVAFRYAHVLYNLAPLKERLKDELNAINGAISDIPNLRKIILAPHINKKQKEQILRVIFKDTEEPWLLDFLSYLLRKNRLIFLPEIINAYKILVSKEAEAVEIKMITASGASDEAKRDLIEKLEKMYEKKVILEEEIDPQILGGVILIMGNRMLDASMTQQLFNLKEKLLETGI